MAGVPPGWHRGHRLSPGLWSGTDGPGTERLPRPRPHSARGPRPPSWAVPSSSGPCSWPHFLPDTAVPSSSISVCRLRSLRRVCQVEVGPAGLSPWLCCVAGLGNKSGASLHCRGTHTGCECQTVACRRPSAPREGLAGSSSSSCSPGHLQPERPCRRVTQPRNAQGVQACLRAAHLTRTLGHLWPHSQGSVLAKRPQPKLTSEEVSVMKLLLWQPPGTPSQAHQTLLQELLPLRGHLCTQAPEPQKQDNSTAQ